MSSQDLRKRAEKAREKPAPFGPDLDLSLYDPHPRELQKTSLTSLSKEEQRALLEAGIDPFEANRSGSYLQMNRSVVFCQTKAEGLEILSTEEALRRYDWLESQYWWKALEVDEDKYTSFVELNWQRGYFIRVLPGVKILRPVQACLFLAEESVAQAVHNIIIVEPGAELHVVTGCLVAPALKSGLHIGVSEFYVKRGGRLSFTMIHNWGEGVAVRPRTATIVEDGGTFLSNYICLRPVKSLQMYPTTYLRGEGSIALYNNLLLAMPGSSIDVGGRVFLEASGSRAEVRTRAITKGGDIWTRGHLIGMAPGVRAHLECQGLILSPSGLIKAIPELEGRVPDVQLSHEASIGKIAKEEIEYLMTRGLSYEEAKAIIVRGFMRIREEALPQELQRLIDEAVKASTKYLL
ncbi:MAG: SufD family Fe-S cluster assembly protein [Candidatus Bathyarchaeia archaeon]